MVAAAQSPVVHRFTTDITDLRNFNIQRIPAEKANQRPTFAVSINDRPVKTTERFWTSLTSMYSKYGLNMNLFRSGLFSPEEAFERLVKVATDGNVKYTIQEQVGKDEAKLLAVVNPTKSVVKYADVESLLTDYNGEDTNVTYLDGHAVDNLGIVRSTHTPPRMEGFQVAGELFAPKFTFEVPIDGYGSPKIMLSCMRMVCSNGLVGYAPAFTTTINTGSGKDQNTMFSVNRALESFSNEEGFGALRKRLESSTLSWCSVNESVTMYKVMAKVLSAKYIQATSSIADEESDATHVMKAWHRLTGDVSQIYGVAHADALSNKRMRTLPVRCTVYDMINFATEVATHHCEPTAAKTIHAAIGGLIGSGEEYDLEGSKTTMPEFTDYFLDRSGIEMSEGADPENN